MAPGRTPRAAEVGSRDGGLVDFRDRPPPSPRAVDKHSALAETQGRVGAFHRWKDRYGAGKPDPWLQMKGTILVVFALIIWSFYVIVGRVCTPMIRGTSSTGLGKATGAGSLVGFVILWLMFIWSYLRIIMTGPGFARDHRTPVFPSHGPQTDYIPYHPPPNVSPGDRSHLHGSFSDRTADPGPNPSEFAPVSNLVQSALQSSEDRPSSSDTDTSSKPAGKKRAVKDWQEVERPMPRVDLGPRWCRFCEINKPDRTHHCRHCGTCVLQFDHHCLWIGQCVGWANHKFFINFNTWTVLFTAYILIFLIIVISKSRGVDGESIGLIAVSALFCLFTAMMLPTHIHLILSGKTTVESFAARDQHQREADVLQREYGYLWHNMEKRKVRRKWKEEWGGVPVDARWRFGTMRQQWEQEMGTNPLGWILPVGRPLGDGVHIPSNPRFGPNGEWLKRNDWPKEYR